MTPSRPPLALCVQFPDPRLESRFSETQLRHWVEAALFAPAELTLRFVATEEGRMLNRDYRGKDYPTNVLTFCYTEDADAATQADIVLCTDVLESEVLEQETTLEAHVCHLVIHGVLHAQGYDHEDDDEAAEMEQIEADILGTLGFANPYAREQE